MSRPKQTPAGRDDDDQRRFGYAERDIVALGIAAAAIIMFLGTGSAVLPQVVQSITGMGIGPDKMLVNALLLNVALIIFGWRRYRQLVDEIADRKKAEEHARILAETDPLTGALNRRSFGAATNALIARREAAGQLVAVMMVDLDNFKQINDFNGHAAGDEILQECARRIQSVLPEHGLLARLGGDEFACAVPYDPRIPGSVDQLASTMIAAIDQPVRLNGSILHITASIGITRSNASGMVVGTKPTAKVLLHMADTAMYHAKKDGRHRHRWFEELMEDELRLRNEIEAGIRRGIPLGEFVPYYEQQIDLQSGIISGFEVLARWRSPNLGLVTPDVFIPIAEEIGAIGELSESIIAQALEEAKGWDPRLSLAVNISPVQLRDPWFAQKLLKLLVTANFPPERLEIEITESCLHENMSVVRSLISSLKNQGIRVSLDDFGTGYSSLAQLRNLSFDRIKIDRTFVSNLKNNQDAEAIVQGIALLGKGLGLPVTAEGVECAGILEKLRQYGDIKGQGYLYGTPQPADEVRKELAGLDLLALPESDIAPALTSAPATAAAAAAIRRVGNG